MAAIFLGTHIVTVKLRHGDMENVYIACLMLVAVTFMRAVSEVGHLLLLFGNTKFQAESGKEREGGIPLSIHRNPDFPVAVYGPYGMQSQEGLDEHRCYGEITGNGNNTLSQLRFTAIYLDHASVIAGFLPYIYNISVIVRGSPVNIPFHRRCDKGFPVALQFNEIPFFFPEFVVKEFVAKAESFRRFRQGKRFSLFSKAGSFSFSSESANWSKPISWPTWVSLSLAFW